MRKATPEDKIRFRNIAPVRLEDGSPKVMKPEALVALLSQMLTGDERAPKNAGVQRRAANRASNFLEAAAAGDANTAAELLDEMVCAAPVSKTLLITERSSALTSGGVRC